jgi:hypothetical protein
MFLFPLAIASLLASPAVVSSVGDSQPPVALPNFDMRCATAAELDDASFAVDAMEYYLVHGSFDTQAVAGTTFVRYLPIGDGPHVLEFKWKGNSEPLFVSVPGVGLMYIDQVAILVDFKSQDHTVFTADGERPLAFNCDGTYTNVLSVVTQPTGNMGASCWGMRIVNQETHTESHTCNRASGTCEAIITFTTNPPAPKTVEFACGQGGVVDFNSGTHTSHVTNATSGC